MNNMTPPPVLRSPLSWRHCLVARSGQVAAHTITHLIATDWLHAQCSPSRATYVLQNNPGIGIGREHKDHAHDDFRGLYGMWGRRTERCVGTHTPHDPILGLAPSRVLALFASAPKLKQNIATPTHSSSALTSTPPVARISSTSDSCSTHRSQAASPRTISSHVHLPLSRPPTLPGPSTFPDLLGLQRSNAPPMASSLPPLSRLVCRLQHSRHRARRYRPCHPSPDL